jgi:hypothetical protein
MVTPIGPNFESSYYSASGLGYGIVYSEAARFLGQSGERVYFFYDPASTKATLEAYPYKTGTNGYYQ